MAASFDGSSYILCVCQGSVGAYSGAQQSSSFTTSEESILRHDFHALQAGDLGHEDSAEYRARHVITATVVDLKMPDTPAEGDAAW